MQPDGNSTTTITVSSDVRQALEDQITDLTQTLFELSVMVYDFQPGGNQLVQEKINHILEHYKDIDDLKEGIDLYIPEEVINYVEHGRNPDLFTQGFVERAATENQFTNGKINAISEFRSLLSEEFSKEFPDLYDNTQNMFDTPPPTDSKTVVAEEGSTTTTESKREVEEF